MYDIIFVNTRRVVSPGTPPGECVIHDLADVQVSVHESAGCLSTGYTTPFCTIVWCRNLDLGKVR